jgi:type VI secretion protein, VC_A0107 family
MPKASSQKFIARNRAPRVQIEYDVEIYGAEKKIELPFIMGVMADLSGKPEESLGSVDQRKFLEIDVDNFDDRLKGCKPRVAFQVPNTLTGEGNLMVDLSFESMDDFSPGAVARKVDALNQLLTARNQLSNLVTYMDGKSGAEELVAKLLHDPALLKTLASAPKPEIEEKAKSEA